MNHYSEAEPWETLENQMRDDYAHRPGWNDRDSADTVLAQEQRENAAIAQIRREHVPRQKTPEEIEDDEAWEWAITHFLRRGGHWRYYETMEEQTARLARSVQ